MSHVERSARPVELGIATAVLMALGLTAAVVGLLIPDTGPLAATAAVGGLMITILAGAAWFGSVRVHRTLVATVVVVVIALLGQHAAWSALALAAAGVLTALPRVRAWYRQAA
ncbi:hypothetical protein [Umezawaea sp. NPDC059074]|uniref:hypothetical protein n=1 Tax=Umezawaea sp. NPDC059074 TaxID=3346716 RepID=UPI0036C1E260